MTNLILHVIIGQTYMISYVVVMFARTARLRSESQSRDASLMVDVHMVSIMTNTSEPGLGERQILGNLLIP